MSSQVTIAKANASELSELQKICIETYSIYFSGYWENEGLELYLENQFGTINLKSDLLSNHIEYYFICFGKEPIGFLKINLNASFDGISDNDSCELEKMYIYPKYKGMGIGTLVLNMIIDNIRGLEKRTLYLEVLNTNVKWHFIL